MKKLFYIFLISLLASSSISLAQKKIYIANDDHTDYMWKGDEEAYRQAFIEMIDYYLDLADATANEPTAHQSRFNCDGSFWLWTYEKNKSQLDFQRLINHIKSGHISAPLTALVSCYGGVPTEAVLRGMYYAGKLEREYDLRFKMAVAMENQTLPYGLGALWAGAGAKYSWRGICGCVSRIPDAWDREHDIYWWVGADGSRILMKWNSMITHTASQIGGYAEAMSPDDMIFLVDSNAEFRSRYPYDIIGVFGYGGDWLKTKTSVFVDLAKDMSTAQRQVIVSNEVDFFQDFEAQYGASLPEQSVTFGNEWDLYCASMAEVSARVKRAVEKLRSAEALATLVSIRQPGFMQGRRIARDNAWMNLGLYWEHDWTADGDVSREQRAQWQRKLARGIEDYSNDLYQDAAEALGRMIKKTGQNQRFYVFNPLSWKRTDFADFPFAGTQPVHVVDLSSGKEVPSQIINLSGRQYMRIYAADIPPIGYRVYEIRSGQGNGFENAGTANGNIIENAFYKVTVSERGAITSLIDKTRNNREFAATIDGRYLNDLGPGSGVLEAENIGPVSLTLKATSDAPLAHTTRITLFRNSRRIDIRNEITENFSDVRTWGFAFNINSPDVWHEEVGAVIRAKLLPNGGHYSDRNARYDWLTLNHFADISDALVGVTLSNADCYFMKLGRSTVDFLDEQTPLISPLVGGQVDGPNLGIPNQGGDSYFLQRFALTTHGQFNRVDAMRFALEHQNPLVAGEVKGGTEYPEIEYSFLSIDNPNVFLWALKPADDGLDAGIVARLWNLAPQTQQFKLQTFNHDIAGIQQVTHIETPVRTLPVDGGALRASINGSQILTFALRLNDLTSPVELDTFSGILQDGRVLLRWRAASPDGRANYEIQRRVQGGLYRSIGVVSNGGNTDEFSFTDYQLPAGRIYYRLQETASDGRARLSNEIVIDVPMPDQFSLKQNYPNPFNPETQISFDLPRINSDTSGLAKTSLIVYDLSGRRARTLVNDYLQPGHYTVKWRGVDENGNTLSSGLYVYVLKYGDMQQSKQMILLR